MPQAVAQAPSFSTRTPDVANTGNTVSFSLPVLNAGTGPANNVRITDITLGSAARVNPALPLVLGDLGIDNAIAVNATFSINGLAVGSRYLVTIRGTYDLGSATFGFTLNRYITIPAATAPRVAFLAAHVQVAVDPIATSWTYTVFDDEVANSSRFVNAISIDMVAPFNVTGTPSGWAFLTDNFSYVLWYALDQAHHIAPGASLGGFQIQSARTTSEGRAFSITSWNHQTNQADLTALGTTLIPART